MLQRKILIIVAVVGIIAAGAIWSRVRSLPPSSTSEQNQSLLPTGDLSDENALPTRPPAVTVCLPGVGRCPDKSLCPDHGACCDAADPNCIAAGNTLKPLFCLNPGQPDCRNQTICPATGVCEIQDKSYPACVPGSTCADGTTCHPSGYCVPAQPKYIPCLPEKGSCAGGAACPKTGICPY